MPPNGQRLAQRVAAEERHLGQMNLRAANTWTCKGILQIQRVPASGGEGLVARTQRRRSEAGVVAGTALSVAGTAGGDASARRVA